MKEMWDWQLNSDIDDDIDDLALRKKLCFHQVSVTKYQGIFYEMHKIVIKITHAIHVIFPYSK